MFKSALVVGVAGAAGAAAGAGFNPPSRRLQGVGAPPERPSTNQQPDDTTPGGGGGGGVDPDSTTSTTQTPTGEGGGGGVDPDKFSNTPPQNSSSNATKTTTTTVSNPVDPNAYASGSSSGSTDKDTPDPGPSVDSLSAATGVSGGALWGIGKIATVSTNRHRKRSQVGTRAVSSPGDSQGDSDCRPARYIQKADGIPLVVAGVAFSFTAVAKLPIAAITAAALGLSSGIVGLWNLVNVLLTPTEQSDNPPTIIGRSAAAGDGATAVPRSGSDPASSSSLAPAPAKAGALSDVWRMWNSLTSRRGIQTEEAGSGAGAGGVDGASGSDPGSGDGAAAEEVPVPAAAGDGDGADALPATAAPEAAGAKAKAAAGDGDGADALPATAAAGAKAKAAAANGAGGVDGASGDGDLESNLDMPVTEV